MWFHQKVVPKSEPANLDLLQKFYHDRGASILPDLANGEKARVWNEDEKLWKPAIIEQKLDAPRSYKVKIENGQVIRRNRIHIKKTPEDVPFCATQFDLDEWIEDISTTEVADKHSNKKLEESPDRPKNTRQRSQEADASGPKTPRKHPQKPNSSDSIMSDTNKHQRYTCTTSSGREIRKPSKYYD